MVKAPMSIGLPAGARARMSSDDQPSKNNLIVTGRGLLWWSGLSFTIVVLGGVGSAIDAGSVIGALKEFLSVFTGAALIAAAASSVGGLLGFLFGIPRTLQQDLPSQLSTSTSETQQRASYRQSVNTNLEQISDWLTKILVGVGLTQLTEIPRLVWQLAENLSVTGSVPLTVALILNFLICGFFSGYLLTRLFLAGAFYEAETWLSRQTEKANLLTEAGAYDKAASEYEKALQGITPNTPKPQKRAIYEQTIFNFLYKDPPDGFQQAIQYAQQYIVEEPNSPSAVIWAYLAAAYGQQYKYEQERKSSGEVLESIKKKALDAIERALAIGPDVKGLLKMMWDPNAIKSPGDDDLEVFYEMEQFRKLLG